MGASRPEGQLVSNLMRQFDYFGLTRMCMIGRGSFGKHNGYVINFVNAGKDEMRDNKTMAKRLIIWTTDDGLG